MSLLDTLRRAADNYPGGRSTISHRNGWNDEYTRKQLTGSATHKMGAVDALALSRLCIEAGSPHAYDYPAYVAEECGGKFVLQAEVPEQEQNPMRRVSVLAREAGDVTAVFIDALQDGIVTDNELAGIELEIAQAEEALRRLRQAARAVNAAGKPGHVVLPVHDRMRDESVCAPAGHALTAAQGV